MADKRVTLVHRDGFEYSVPADDKVEINQAKARGFRVKPEPKRQTHDSSAKGGEK